MKKTFKNITKLGILLFGISVAITSCQKDDELLVIEEESTTQEVPQLKATVADFKTQLKGNTNAKNKLNKFRSSNTLSRTLYSDTYNFSIDTTSVQKIETQSYSSFTFVVEREQINLELVENYVLTQFNDDRYTQYLISYPIVNGEPDISTGSLEVINDDSLLYNRIQTPCEGLMEYQAPVCIDYNCGDAGDHSPGEACTSGEYVAYRKCTEGGWVNTGCSTGGGSTDSGTGDPADSNNGGNTNTGGDTTPPDDEEVVVVVVPLVPAWQQIVNCINGTTLGGITDTSLLSTDMIAWLSTNTSKKVNQLNAYLKENLCNQDAQEFGILAAEGIKNGSDIDYVDKIVIDPTFINNQKAKCVYDKLKNFSSNYFSNILSDFDNNKLCKLTFKVTNIPQTSPTETFKAKTLPRFNVTGLRTFDIILDQQFVNDASLIEIAFTLIHELIHAEIMERCMQLGIVTGAVYNTTTWDVSNNFSNGSVISSDLPSALFSMLVSQYSNYVGPVPNGGNWQHNLYDVAGYRAKISEDLEEVHGFLDDPSNPFASNLNNGTVIALTMSEYFDLITWAGLHGTDAYNNLSALDNTKINQALNQTEQFYNENCN